MSISQFLTSSEAGDVLGKCSIALAILFTLVQISPIKINPWSWLGKLVSRFFDWLGKRIGKAISGEIVTDLGEIKNRLSELEKHDKWQDAERAEDKALDARRRVLQFADEIRRKTRHSEEHFNNIFEDINYYKTYCGDHKNFENDRARISIKIIEETYERCAREDDFL